MAYQHRSGAQKRKEKEVKEKRASQGQIRLDSLGFFGNSDTKINLFGDGSSASCSNDTKPTRPITNSDHSQLNQDADHADDAVSEYRHTETDSNSHTKTTNDTFESNESTETQIKPTINEGNEGEQIRKFDIGMIETEIPSRSQVEEAVRRGPESLPNNYPADAAGRAFPLSVLKTTMPNGEKVSRDWIAWSDMKQALFCFPCRLFSKLPAPSRSSLAMCSGFSSAKSWKKLHDKIPEHENSTSHRTSYVEWRTMELRLSSNSAVDSLLLQSIQNEQLVWKQVLHRILDVTLFLGERGLAFRGNNNLIGDPRNGNFLGILELISHYDPLLAEHLSKVKESQKEHRRLQVHYLSPESQNEFIQCCASKVTDVILTERANAKYYCIIVDATPDSAHVEQTVFILRYVHFESDTNRYKVEERFLKFVDCNNKTGEEIARLILETLKEHTIPITNCRGQGYDNGSNMSGKYKGAQAHILKQCPLATYSPCACHSLNLCGVHAAESCPKVITFFGVIQKLYAIFSSSPRRWEILKQNIGCSLHSMSQTRWSARVDSVRPFAAHIGGLKTAVENALEMNLTPETRADLDGILTYLGSFECVIMASVWLKILTAIDYRNKVLQARGTTLDIEVENIKSLIKDMKCLRDNWNAILDESKLVAQNYGIENSFSFTEKRRKKRRLFADETKEDTTDCDPEEKFKHEVFYVLLDCVIGNMTTRYDAAMKLESVFGVLWKYPHLKSEVVQDLAQTLHMKYQADVSANLVQELEHLRVIHPANLGENALQPLELLNKLHTLKLEALFPNIVVLLRIFCTLPVTVAQAERSFSTLSRVKNVMRSTMCQNRLTSLGTLAVEARLARKVNFETIIEMFAKAKSRKAPLL